jgi:RNA polymerase sigma factor (sigma-70 family)
MYTTSLTLLQKLRNPENAAAWDRFVELYFSLLSYWARKVPLQGLEPADLVQDVFVKLLRVVPTFAYDRARGGFRSWLRTVCHNHWRDHLGKPANRLVQADDVHLEALAAADDGLEQFWNLEYDAILIAEAFRLLETEFDPISREIFTKVMLNGRPVQEVAENLGITSNAASTRKFRILRRLRQELTEFLEE